MSESSFHCVVRTGDCDRVFAVLAAAGVRAVVDRGSSTCEWTVVVTDEPARLAALLASTVVELRAAGQDPGHPWQLRIVGGGSWRSGGDAADAACVTAVLGCAPEILLESPTPWAFGRAIGLPLVPMLDLERSVPAGTHWADDLE